ncbi:MAG: signal peptidase [Rhodopirellula sp. TMED11]|nr:MAG: signal peptidase [Rhodopirellula sp. TMED11]
MRLLGVMNATESYRYQDAVIVRTDRGTETGIVLIEASPASLESGEESVAGRVVRAQTSEDQKQVRHLQSLLRADLAVCQKQVDTLRLTMDLVDVERLFGGERVIIYYVAESRVDFRQLVRELAREFQTRIEMRQIGVRDEAKLVADYGDCGRPICCASFLSKMPPVSMKMAKLQRSTLDPTKISGRCGRLKCCLRYEFDTYEEMSRQLPPVGAQLLTKDGNVQVIAQDILSQQLMVLTSDNRKILISSDKIVSVLESP